MEVLKIDKGMPIPDSERKRSIYPCKDMVPGDSFFIENPNRNGIYSALSHYRHRYNMKFLTRQEKGGIRVWRIA